MNVYNQMFRAKSLLARIWEKLRCSSVSEWVYRLWHIQTMDNYSELNWNEILSHKKTWRNLKCLILAKETNLKKLYSIWFQIMMLWKRQNYCKKSVVAKCWMGAEMNWWSTEDLGDNETILYSAQYHKDEYICQSP